MAGVSRVPYPVLPVHGTAFRDYVLSLYWGRIPRALRKEGAAVFYGKAEGWGSVAHNGALLARRIEQVLSQTGHKSCTSSPTPRAGWMRARRCRLAARQSGRHRSPPFPHCTAAAAP